MSACPPNSETGRFRREKQRPDWRPYCLKCSTMGRMTETEFGFRCDGVADHFGRRGCGNTINWDLTHYDVSAPIPNQQTSSPAASAAGAGKEQHRD